jgi:hypothetical protein
MVLVNVLSCLYIYISVNVRWMLGYVSMNFPGKAEKVRNMKFFLKRKTELIVWCNYLKYVHVLSYKQQTCYIKMKRKLKGRLGCELYAVLYM